MKMKNIFFGGITFVLLFVVGPAEATLMKGIWSGQIEGFEGINANNLFTINETVTWEIIYNDNVYQDVFSDLSDPFDPIVYKSYGISDTFYDEKLTEWFALTDELISSRNLLYIISGANDNMIGVEYLGGESDFAMDGPFTGAVGGFFRLSGGMQEQIYLNPTWVNFVPIANTGANNVHAPEPTTMLLFGTGLIGLLAAISRKKKK